MRGRAHGYAVHRELLSWRVETWTSVRQGSIYHALKQLAKEGRLRPVGTEASDEGPGRTLYELTEEGEAEYGQRLRAALQSFSLEDLGTGIAFMGTLTRHEAVALLRERNQRARDVCDGLRRMVPSFPERDAAPHTQDLLGLWSSSIEATADWTDGLIARLEAGEYVMAD